MKIEKTEKGIKVTDISRLSLEETLDCGQCFRWRVDENGIWSGVVKGVYGRIIQEDDGITIIGSDEKQFEDIWHDYFDFDRDYDKLKADFGKNEMLNLACEFAPGIRVLHQEPWEAFITFIISQNNNIARIKGIVDRLCNEFGEEIKKGIHAFPTAEVLAKEPTESFSKLGCGYRAEYISSAAKEVYTKKLDLELLKEMPIDKARERLLKVHGIGPKVADCVLLYGLGRAERCPADVWMKRVLAALGGEMPSCVKDNAGIAQQFLFHYARNFPEKFVEIKTK